MKCMTGYGPESVARDFKGRKAAVEMFWRMFAELCAKAGKSPSRIAEEIGLSYKEGTNS